MEEDEGEDGEAEMETEPWRSMQALKSRRANRGSTRDSGKVGRGGGDHVERMWLLTRPVDNGRWWQWS